MRLFFNNPKIVHFLSFTQIDEENWISRDNDEYGDEPEYRDLRDDYPGIESVVEEQELGYRRMDRRTIYLFLYNLYQFVSFLYIIVVLSIEWNRDGLTLAGQNGFKTVGMFMKTSQMMQYFEVLYALVGYTNGSPLFPFLQVTGRNFVLFAYINAEERIQTKPIVLCLFIVWASVEVVRYPYYIISLLKREIGLLTWLRYSVYVILYPLGFMCEGLVLLVGVHYLEDKGRFSIRLPNKYNFAFDLLYFTKFYMIFVLLPGLYVVMNHMTKLRQKKLKSPKITNKCMKTPTKRKTV